MVDHPAGQIDLPHSGRNDVSATPIASRRTRPSTGLHNVSHNHVFARFRKSSATQRHPNSANIGPKCIPPSFVFQVEPSGILCALTTTLLLIENTLLWLPSAPPRPFGPDIHRGRCSSRATRSLVTCWCLVSSMLCCPLASWSRKPNRPWGRPVLIVDM